MATPPYRYGASRLTGRGGTKTMKIMVAGIPNISSKLAQLPKKIRDEAGYDGLEKACEILIEEGMKQAPVGTHRDIFGRPRRGPRLSDRKAWKYEIILYFKHSFYARVWPAKSYAHLVEFGHEVVVFGKHHGSVPANPFWRRAFNAKKEAAIDALAAEVDAALDRLYPAAGVA